MAAIEVDWDGAAVAASLMTSTGCNVTWQVCVGQRLHVALAAVHISMTLVNEETASTRQMGPVVFCQK